MYVYDVSLILKSKIKAKCYFLKEQLWGFSFKMVDSLVLPPESLMKWKHQKIK